MFDKTILILLAFVPAIDQLITQNIDKYYYAMVLRIITLIGIPLIYVFLKNKKDFIKNLKEPFVIKNKINTLKFSLIGSFLAVLAVTGLFFVLQTQIDFNLLREEISKLYPLNLFTYFLVGLYISFVNPFIEEFYWRGFLFNQYNKLTNKSLWIGVLFALHHFFMMNTWFNGIVLFAGILGLAAVGVFFNWLYMKTDSIYACLTTHAVADITIIVIGYFVLF